MVHEEAAAFALDALDREQTEAFQQHLTACPECDAAVEELRFAAAALAFAVEPLAPSGSLRPRVLDTGAQVIPLRRRRLPRFLAAAMVAAAACAVVVAAVRPWETGESQAGFRRYDAKGGNATLLVSRSGEAVLALGRALRDRARIDVRRYTREASSDGDGVDAGMGVRAGVEWGRDREATRLLSAVTRPPGGLWERRLDCAG